jgi:hypothetical protein
MGDIEEGYEEWSYRTKIIIPRKEHSCCECGVKIEVGEECEFATGFYEGNWDVHYTCSFCLKIIRDFVEDGNRMYGVLWDYMNEVVDIGYPTEIPDWDDEEEEDYLEIYKEEIRKNRASSSWFKKAE